MMIRLAAALFLLPLVLAGCKPDNPTPTAEVLTYGVYRITRPDTSRAAAPGERVVATRVEHERQTETVPATLNGNFGFEFSVRGLPAQKSLVFDLRARHPPIVGTDGVSRTESVSSLPVYTANGNYSNAFIFQFDRAEDLQAGPWVLQVALQGRILAERTFQVTVAR
ncbi:MAG: DUF3859 domain-containing protein [Burkholderiales bacterium]